MSISRNLAHKQLSLVPFPFQSVLKSRRRMATQAAATAPPIPRLSASLVIVNERNEILLVQRNPQASAFGGVTVFPGGNYDKKQDSSLEMTAIRETFEESGLLIASPVNSSSQMPPDAVLDQARFAVHGQKKTFQSFLDEHRLKPDTGLLPFTAWITPIGPPRRFHTQFYVTFLPGASSYGFTAGSKQERLPKPDGGQEVIAARFIRAEDALAEFNARKITFMPPQFYILETLASILRSATNTRQERAAVQQLSTGQFGQMTINPRYDLAQSKPGEKSVLTYEGDETRGGSPGRLHRAVVTTQKGGITTAIVIHRNFDIFTEIEPHVFKASSPAKL
ncbi:NUDIX domain-containing protein [Rhodocollybia butyracea]|uniref:NUDIX domain-containing protein n=1 Tax=Rhodocollybia butyracea TaxID=206335 RepID=A0A9P5PPR6_9AGAR|nr:NUDIX domain-containing protein [Rhodocollybia butyracea]